MHIRRLSILGTGLIGGSVGLACRDKISTSHIIGYSHTAEGARHAVERGAVHESANSPAAAVTDADLIILCTPVGSIGAVLEQIAPSVKAGAIVTDVGSTKRLIVAFAERTLPKGVHFVGSHPMAGGEKPGIAHARADLLCGAKCIITPTETSDPAAVSTVETFWQTLGMKTVRLSPGLHDQRVADISHLPHAVAAALVRMQSPETMELAARGFADTTRIAAGDSGLWHDIFVDNRDNLKAGIYRLQAQLAELSARLDVDDAEGVKDWLATAEEVRRRFEWRRTDETSSE